MKNKYQIFIDTLLNDKYSNFDNLKDNIRKLSIKNKIILSVEQFDIFSKKIWDKYLSQKPLELFNKYKSSDNIERLFFENKPLETLANIYYLDKFISKKFIIELQKNFNKKSSEIYLDINISSNHWNSQVRYVNFENNNIYLIFGVQNNSTDISFEENWDEFFKSNTYRYFEDNGISDNDIDIDDISFEAIYNVKDKLNVLKALLLEYLYLKYPNNELPNKEKILNEF